MITVSGADAATDPLPEGVVPFPLIETVMVPGAAVTKLFAPPQEISENRPRPRISRTQARPKPSQLAVLRRVKRRSNPKNAPGIRSPARLVFEFRDGRTPTIVPAAVLMVMVPWAAFSLPSGFWPPGRSMPRALAYALSPA